MGQGSRPCAHCLGLIGNLQCDFGRLTQPLWVLVSSSVKRSGCNDNLHTPSTSNTLDSPNTFRVLLKELATLSMKDRIKGLYFEQVRSLLDMRRILLTVSGLMGLLSVLVR